MKTKKTKVTSLGGSDFFRRNSLFGRRVKRLGQHLGLAQQAAEIVAEGGVFIPRADALVHDDAQRHHLAAEVAGHVVGHGLAHAHEDAGGAELVAVVVDEAGLDEARLVMNRLVWKGDSSMILQGSRPCLSRK